MISIIIPVIRPEKLPILFDLLRLNTQVPFEVVYETDTKRIGCPKMVKNLVKKTKYDLVMFVGDDCLPMPNFAEEALKEMNKMEWGLVGLNDMQTKEPTHWLAHKKLLPEIGGEFFHTGYTHCFCDNELKYRASKLGRYKWCEEAKIYHGHPMFTQGEYDEDYKRVYADDVFRKDWALFLKRNPDAKDAIKKVMDNFNLS